jgi:hypothetical protein
MNRVYRDLLSGAFWAVVFTGAMFSFLYWFYR